VTLESAISSYSTLYITFVPAIRATRILAHRQTLLQTLLPTLLPSNFEQLLLVYLTQPTPQLGSLLLGLSPPFLDLPYHALGTEYLLLGLIKSVFIQPQFLRQACDLALQAHACIISIFEPDACFFSFAFCVICTVLFKGKLRGQIGDVVSEVTGIGLCVCEELYELACGWGGVRVGARDWPRCCGTRAGDGFGGG